MDCASSKLLGARKPCDRLVVSFLLKWEDWADGKRERDAGLVDTGMCGEEVGVEEFVDLDGDGSQSEDVIVGGESMLMIADEKAGGQVDEREGHWPVHNKRVDVDTQDTSTHD